MSFEVIMRYAFNKPTFWALDTSQILLVFTVYMALAYTLKEDGHIGVDVIKLYLEKKKLTVLEISTSTASLIFCLVFAYLSWDLAWRSHSIGRTTTGLLVIPLFIPQMSLFIGSCLFSLQFLVKIYDHIISLSGRKF
jgi:TRAP-type C4-dicarboxylate transport system permease small subunit